MGITTGIEWCDSTINPIMGCEGCELWTSNKPTEEQHCYAATLVNRYAGRNGWPERFDQPEFFHGRIEKALKWSDLTGTDRADKSWLNGYSRLIFFNDLSDTFLSNRTIPADTWLPDYISVMEASPHTWLFLTKRARTMYRFFRDLGHVPKNFWLGVTVTGQLTANRVLDLVRLRNIEPSVPLWVSFEPLLSDIVIIPPELILQTDWWVVGGESGKNARPMRPDWARSLRDQAISAEIPYFFKQWGEWLPYEHDPESPMYGQPLDFYTDPDAGYSWTKVGKKAAGRLLDGRTWDQMPTDGGPLTIAAGAGGEVREERKDNG